MKPEFWNRVRNRIVRGGPGDRVEKRPGRNDLCPECLKVGVRIKFKKCKEHFRE